MEGPGALPTRPRSPGLRRKAPLVVPVPEVLAAVVVLPLLAVVGALLLSRPIPSWSAFRDLGS